MDPSLNVHLSSLDRDRFGVNVAKTSDINRPRLPEILKLCTSNRVDLLIARCLVDNLPAVQDMERHGFLLMDTLVYYVRDLAKVEIPQDICSILVRPIRRGEEYQVREVAARTFKGYLGHYHADPKLDPKKCDEVYVDWAYRSCLDKNIADEVLVADLDGAVVGFATLKVNNIEDGEGVLFGIDPSAQGRGIYRSFILKGMQWCLDQGMKHMVVSTQINNLAVQRVWVRLDFEPGKAYYTFHKWFTDQL